MWTYINTDVIFSSITWSSWCSNTDQMSVSTFLIMHRSLSLHCAFHHIRQQITKYVMLMTGSSTEVPDQRRQLKGSYLLTNGIWCWCWAALTVYWFKEHNIVAVFSSPCLSGKVDDVAGSESVWSRKSAEHCLTDGRRPVKWVAMGSRWRRDRAGDQRNAVHILCAAHSTSLVFMKG